MNKYILEIEFRFNTIPTTEYVNGCNSRKYMLGEADTYDAIRDFGNNQRLEILKRLGGSSIEIPEGDLGVFRKLDDFLGQETISGYIKSNNSGKRVCRFFISIRKVEKISIGAFINKAIRFLGDEVTHPDDI